MGVAVILIISQLCGQLYPLYLAKIYNTAAGKIGESNYWSDIINFTLIASVLGLGKILLFGSTMFIAAKIFPDAKTMVIKDSFDYVNRHSIAYFNQEMSGNISNKVTLLNGGVIEAFNETFHIVSAFFYLLITIIILSMISLHFMIAMFVWLAVVINISLHLGRKRVILSKETSKLQSKSNGVIVDSLSNYSEIKSFANFKFERLNLLKYLRVLRHAENKEQTVKAWIHLTLNLVMVASMLAFMFLAIWVFKKQYISSTEFIYANTLFAMISGMVFEITWTYNNIARIYGQMESALETLAVEPEIINRPNAKKLTIKKADINFEDVSFAYKDRENIFKNMNLSIKAGEKIGLVGHSGSGKSTFIKLIARYFDINSGAITINGHDVRNITQDSLHKIIATIPQDVCLFNRTLFENIKYGKTNASDEEVYRAAKKASADEFIKSFPDGYQTKVGDRGVVLSGGERQRISIARAILKNAPILIFDEATSALDSQSEAHIQKSLKALMMNKTVIAIAHRLSTLREMDRILVFDKGRIVESGTHLSLLRKKGVYYKLYNMQADGFMGSIKSKEELSTTL